MRRRLIAMLVVGGLFVALGTALAAEGDGDGDAVAATPVDTELVERLRELQDELPELVPTAADLAANDLDPVLLGSFATARGTLDRLEDDIRQLYIDGDEAGTAAGDAVSSVARGLLLERQALIVLEQSDGSSNPRPADSSNARTEAGLAIDADGLLGLESTGIDLLIQSRDLQRQGYEVLQDVEGADGVFADRLEELRLYEEDVTVVLRIAASELTDELLVPVDRFDAPVGSPRAVSVSYVCVDRAEYLALADLSEAEQIAGSVEEVPGTECAEMARRAGLSLADQQAQAEDGASDDDVDVDVDVDADEGDDVDVDVDVDAEDG